MGAAGRGGADNGRWAGRRVIEYAVTYESGVFDARMPNGRGAAGWELVGWRVQDSRGRGVWKRPLGKPASNA